MNDTELLFFYDEMVKTNAEWVKMEMLIKEIVYKLGKLQVTLKANDRKKGSQSALKCKMYSYLTQKSNR